MSDTPQMFRINVEVGDLAAAQNFYEALFAAQGRGEAGNRFSLSAGPVTLQVVDVTALGGSPHPAAKALYFNITVNDLDALHARASSLNCLSNDMVHNTPGGVISVKPWGERSFYANDPWGNPLCFVEAGAVYGG